MKNRRKIKLTVFIPTAIIMGMVIIIGIWAISSILKIITKDASSVNAQKPVPNTIASSQNSHNAQSSSKDSVLPSPGKKIAYLTFDDGPSEYTPQLLKILKENNVKATFFITFMGKDTPEKRSWIKLEADDGHALGVHSWTHNYSIVYANEDSFVQDFNTMNDIIISATGVQPKVCRFPGGIGNSVFIKASKGKIKMSKLVADVNTMGFKAFDWNAGGEDARTPYPTKDQLVQDVLKDSKNRDNVVILLHDIHKFTVEAVPDIIKQLKSQGYTFDKLTPESKTVQQPCAKDNH